MLRLKCHVEQRIQPLQPASDNSIRSLPEMGLLNALGVLADLSYEDSFPHTLDPKYRCQCLPYVTELYLGVKT